MQTRVHPVCTGTISARWADCRSSTVTGSTITFFWSDDALCGRTVSTVVLSGRVDIAAPSARLLADWERDIAQQLGLEAGDVAPLSLARARMRWPDYAQAVQAVAQWTRQLGLGDIPVASEVALMACRGARYHHDAAQYADRIFCNLFISEDKGLDVHFPAANQRIALERGTVLIFDTAQPHAVIPRDRDHFNATDFSVNRDCSQVFLTWEIPVTRAAIVQALGIEPVPPVPCLPDRMVDPVRVDGAPVSVCPQTGAWLPGI